MFSTEVTSSHPFPPTKHQKPSKNFRDTGTLLWTHVVLTIFDKTAKEFSFLSSERFQFFLTPWIFIKLEVATWNAICAFCWPQQTALCDYEDKAELFCVRILFCFARNKVKEVIELTLRVNKNKSKQKTERSGKEKLSIDATGEKDCEKDGKARKKVARLEFLSQKLILFTAFI